MRTTKTDQTPQRREHTPGPWTFDDKYSTTDTFFITGPKHQNVVEIHRTIEELSDFGSDAEDRANARLIAAAPDLLEACQNARNVLAAIAVGDLKEVRANSPALQMLRNAIAKAEGR